MFNGDRQWSTEPELDADLPVLLGLHPLRGADSGLRAELTEGEQAVGRFFFVHQGGATRDGKELRTFEFLHATFCEFLIGRLIARELLDIAQTLESTHSRSRSADLDDSFLHALLSFSPLTMRNSAVAFLSELIQEWPAERRKVLRKPVLELFRRAMSTPSNSRYAGYQPQAASAPKRHAAYSCNLLLLLIMLSDEIRASELFPIDKFRDLGWRWRNLALLWRSQFPPEGWSVLVEILAVQRARLAGTRDVIVSLKGMTSKRQNFDIYWQYWDGSDDGSGLEQPQGWVTNPPESIMKHSFMIMDRRTDVLAHIAEPFSERFPEALTTFARTSSGVTRSAANALIALWLAVSVGEMAEVQGKISGVPRCSKLWICARI